MMERAVTVLALAFFLTSAFQTFELVREANLSALYASLEIPVQQANEVREQTVALGMETAELADKGNADAQQAVNEMRNQGIESSGHPPRRRPVRHPNGRYAAAFCKTGMTSLPNR